MIERITSRFLLEHRIPIYQERAAYYRRRAIIESLQEGIIDHYLDESEGKDVVEAAESTSVTIPGRNEQIEFAFDREGVAFARIENGKFYRINTDRSQEDLVRAKRYEELCNSFWKRRIYEPFKGKPDDFWFGVNVRLDNIGDTISRTAIVLIQLSDQLKKREEEIFAQNTN